MELRSWQEKRKTVDVTEALCAAAIKVSIHHLVAIVGFDLTVAGADVPTTQEFGGVVGDSGGLHPTLVADVMVAPS